MSNSHNELSPASRAMLTSALLGGSASAAAQWQAYRQGEVSIEELTQRSLKDAAKAGLAGGLATAVAGQMAGRPLLSLTTVLAAGAASLYLMDDLLENSREEN